MELRPDHKYISLIKNKRAPKDPIQKELWNYLKKGRPIKNKNLKSAWYKYSNPTSRFILYALLIGELDIKDIADLLQTDVKTIEIFVNLFFDRDILQDRLDKIAYYKQIEEEVDPEIRPWLRAACYGKEDYLKLLLGGTKGLDVPNILKNLIIDLIAVAYGFSRKQLDDYTKYVNTLVKALELSNKISSTSSRVDILDKIKFVVEEKKLDVQMDINQKDIVSGIE